MEPGHEDREYITSVTLPASAVVGLNGARS